MKRNKEAELLEIMPSELEMVRLSGQVKKAVASKAELLNIIGGLELESMPLEERMIYVLGLISLGFDESRAKDRLGVTNAQFYAWEQHPEHQGLLNQSIARGEMILEERVLARAEIDPEMAFKVLERKDRKKERKEDKKQEEKKSVLDWMKESAHGRGIVKDAQIVDDILK